MTTELVQICVQKAKNRQEAQASLRGALKVIATFPRSTSEILEEGD